MTIFRNEFYVDTVSYYLPFFVVMVVVTRSLTTVVTRSLTGEISIMTERKLSMANTPATPFSSITITTSLKDVLLSMSNNAFTSVYTQQQEESILLTTSSAALSSSVFKATTSRSIPLSTEETEAGIQHKVKIVRLRSGAVVPRILDRGVPRRFVNPNPT